MRHAPRGSHLHPQRALGRDGNLIFRGLAVYQKFRAIRLFVRHFRAQTVTFFAHQKKQPDVDAFLPQPLRRRNLNRDDALGIARAASVNARHHLRAKG